MAKQHFEKFNGREVTDMMLAEASVLFSENYGIWGEDAAKTSPSTKPGSRARLSTGRLRAQCLPDAAACSYVRVTVDSQLAGNAFACRWNSNGKRVCWITQLVVQRSYRERGLATRLLDHLREYEDDVYGITSSHPATCLAAARAFGGGMDAVSLAFVREHTKAVITASPINYIRNAKLCGRLFDSDDKSGLVSSVDTNFFINHTEPLEALVRRLKRTAADNFGVLYEEKGKIYDGEMMPNPALQGKEKILGRNHTLRLKTMKPAEASHRVDSETGIGLIKRRRSENFRIVGRPSA